MKTTKPVGEYLSTSFQLLKGHWGLPIAALVVVGCITTALSIIPFVGYLALLIIAGPLDFGLFNYYLRFSREASDNDIGNIFSGFQNSKFGPSLGAYWLSGFAVCGGLFLLIIPGIIIGLRLGMVYFVLNDNKNMTAVEAMKVSWNIMAGNGGKLFLMLLAFCGLTILSAFTFFIGLLWLYPLFLTSVALFYEDIK